MERVVYISESRIGQSDQEHSTAEIVAVAQDRNAKLLVTGALIFTGTYFAQILEGPKASVDAILVSLENDPRHANIKIVERLPITKRKFPDWQMAYEGGSQFVSGHVVGLLQRTSRSEQQRAIQRLTTLACEFTTKRDPNIDAS